MGDVEGGQNGIHESNGTSVPVEPDPARPSHPGVLERTATLIERVRADWLFLAIALPWGLALVFLVPPFRVFDEPVHYERAWSVADGQLLSAPDGTVRVPTNVAALFNFAMATKPRDLPHLLSEPISRASARVYTPAAGYGPIGYLPQAIGIDVVRLMRGSPLAAFYAGRLANLLASLLLICLAVRLVPFGKLLLVTCGLLPMGIAQMAGLGNDGMAIAGAFFFTAMIIKMSTVERLNVYHGLAVIAGVLFLLNAKPGYAALAILVLMLKPSQFARGRGAWAALLAAACACAVVVTAITMATQPHAPVTQANTPPSNISAAAQLGYLAHHPLRLPEAYWNTVNASAMGFILDNTGVFDWGRLRAPGFVTLITLVALVLAWMRREATSLDARQRWSLIVSATSVGAVVLGGMYLMATPVGANVVAGIQGRYWLPILPAVVFSVYGLRVRREAVTTLLVLGLMVLTALLTVRLIVSYFYQV